MNAAYPLDHYLNSGNREVTFVYCVDALAMDKLNSGSACRECLLRDGDECGANPDGDGRKVCPFLEVNPLYYGTTTRLKQRRKQR